MEVSALKYSGRGGLYARSPLLRLQSDERLVAVIRRGNAAAFELLVSRYQTRLLAFCRHLLRSREDAEDVLQEVLTAAYNAMLSDDRPINVRPWLYRIARNRCLNHLRKTQAVGVDSMDMHFSDNGASTADKVHEREEFRQLVGDIHGLPETQRTALVLREMDALSYEQIAEAMDTTVPSVKSLLVRARVSLAEASEARLLTCDEVREELGEAAEGLIKKPSPAVRRHVKSCSRCERFENEIRHSSKALAAALVPIGIVGMLRKLLLVHLLGHAAGSGAAGASATGTGAVAGAAGAGAAGAGTAGAGAAGAGAAGAAGAGSAGMISAGVGAVATKAAAGLAAAALVTAGTVAVSHDTRHHVHGPNGLQVLTTSVNAGVARANAIAPQLAAPVRPVPAARPARASGHEAHAAKPADATLADRLTAAVHQASTAVAVSAGTTKGATSTSVTRVGQGATAAAATGASMVATTATAPLGTTPTTVTTPVAAATLTTTTTATTTTPNPTPTGTTTTAAATTTTPATTSTTPPSTSVTGGQGIAPDSSVTTTVTTPAPPS